MGPCPHCTDDPVRGGGLNGWLLVHIVGGFMLVYFGSSAEIPDERLRAFQALGGGGVPTLIVEPGGVTPQGARVADLLAGRDGVDAGGIGYLLVRGNDQRPVLAIATTMRPELERALAAAFAW